MTNAKQPYEVEAKVLHDFLCECKAKDSPAHKRIRDALLSAERAGIEKAAKVADNALSWETGEEIATKIRRLPDAR